jgi:hypothetical protein
MRGQGLRCIGPWHSFTHELLPISAGGGCRLRPWSGGAQARPCSGLQAGAQHQPAPSQADAHQRPRPWYGVPPTSCHPGPQSPCLTPGGCIWIERWLSMLRASDRQRLSPLRLMTVPSTRVLRWVLFSAGASGSRAASLCAAPSQSTNLTYNVTYLQVTSASLLLGLECHRRLCQ